MRRVKFCAPRPEFVVATAVLVAIILSLMPSFPEISLSRRYHVEHEAKVSPLPRHDIPGNFSLFPRAWDDKNDADPDWIDNLWLLLSEEKFNALEASEQKTRAEAARKGLILLCSMQSRTERYPTKAEFKPRDGTAAADIMKAYGWTGSPTRIKDPAPTAVQNLRTALDDLGIEDEPSDWIRSNLYHSKNTKFDGKNYIATHGSYENYVDLVHGVVIANSNWSPRSQLEKRGINVTPDKVIPFARWSDVVWVDIEQAIDLFQDEYAVEGKSVAKLEHFLKHNIISQDSIKTFRMVTGAQWPVEVGLWPGKSYPMTEPQALALLSTPNAYGIAWMLAQHKDKMGIRMIDRINIFNCPDQYGDAWCLYLHVADVPAESQDPPTMPPPGTKGRRSVGRAHL